MWLDMDFYEEQELYNMNQKGLLLHESQVDLW